MTKTSTEKLKYVNNPTIRIFRSEVNNKMIYTVDVKCGDRELREQCHLNITKKRRNLCMKIRAMFGGYPSEYEGDFLNYLEKEQNSDEEKLKKGIAKMEYPLSPESPEEIVTPSDSQSNPSSTKMLSNKSASVSNGQSAELLSAEYGNNLEFPLDAMPEVLRPLIEIGSHSIQCPPEFIAVPLLVGMGAAIGRTRKVRVKDGYEESTALWAIIVGDSGTAKSPAFELATDPLQKIEAMGRIQPVSITCSLETSEESPAPRRIVVTDTTVEALVPLMAENPKGLILVGDEFSGWVAGMNQYKGSKGSDIQFYLRVWSGGSHTVDRKTGREHIVLPNTYLAVVGGIQPDVLSDLLQRERQQDGFASRLLISYPPNMARDWTREGTPDDVIEPVQKVYEQLARLDFDPTAKKPNQPVIVGWTEAAYEVLEGFMQKNRTETNLPGMGSSLRAAWTKMESYFCRISLIIQMIRLAAGETKISPIEKSSAVSAVRIIEYFKSQAHKFYRTAEKREGRVLHEKVHNWAIRRKFSVLTPRLIVAYRFVETAEEARTILDDMEKFGWGKWRYKRGKKVVFVLYPTQQLSNSAKINEIPREKKTDEPK